MKIGKAAEIYIIPLEAIREGGPLSEAMLHDLLNKIWREEAIPEDSKKGLLVKLPKKGNLTQTNNWWGITLIPIPSKILTRVMLNRMKVAVDAKLRGEQAGFRQDRSCTDQIATLGIIIEQSIEWNSSLYMNFIDFRKAFDSIDRQVAWRILRHYGLPENFVRLITGLHDDFTCQVIHQGYWTQPFAVNSGVGQGCLLSPLIFLVVLDWVTRSAFSKHRVRIQWTLNTRLEYADELCLLSHRLQDLRSRTEALAEAGKHVGLSIKSEKTKVMRIHSRQTGSIS